jgi:hypothetical protein
VFRQVIVREQLLPVLKKGEMLLSEVGLSGKRDHLASSVPKGRSA